MATSRVKVSRSIQGSIAIFLVLGIVAAFTFLPVLYSLTAAFKPLDELFIYPPKLTVNNPTFSNFTTMFQLVSNTWVPFARYLFNSLFISCAGTILHMVLSSLAAYPLAKHRFIGRAFLSKLIVLMLLFTSSVTYIPQYIVIAKLGLINTYWPILLTTAQWPLGLFLMQNFMSQIPPALLEAAKIDGSGEFRTLFSIVLPQVKPALFTLLIFAFQQVWNNTGATFVYSENMKALPTVMTQIASGGIARAGVGAAVSIFLLIPPLIIFLVSQSKVIETMASSGIK